MMKRKELVKRTVPKITDELKRMPLSVAVTHLMKDMPKKAEIYGVRLPDGSLGLEFREKTWIEQEV